MSWILAKQETLFEAQELIGLFSFLQFCAYE